MLIVLLILLGITICELCIVLGRGSSLSMPVSVCFLVYSVYASTASESADNFSPWLEMHRRYSMPVTKSSSSLETNA